ncbi:aldo/keto reductase [Candidatus Pelagibacter sp.]|jgi:aryl-alcohol dehydrogenase-like predicted oxidoreductase|nr:aldo/keto reductase [Candidatus Pelagibacter sp.]
MKYNNFSDTGWKVSEIGLGCWQIGWCWGDVEDQDARELLNKAIDKGINYFDTSDTYGDGRSERFLGELIKSTSEKIYISTKLGRRIRGTSYTKGYKQAPMEEFLDRSLMNIGVDCIDIVQLHCPPFEVISKKETFEMMDELKKKGKIQYYGVSVHTIADAMEAIKNPNVKSIQLVFNIFRQKPIEEFLKAAKKKNVAVIARGPLASGLLTGQINKDTYFPENDHRNYNRKGEAFDIGDTFSGVDFDKGIEAVERLKKILPKDFSLVDLSLKWILMQEGVTSVIPGAINKSQVEINSRSSELEDISLLLPKIKSIYDELIKPDVHTRW